MGSSLLASPTVNIFIRAFLDKTGAFSLHHQLPTYLSVFFNLQIENQIENQAISVVRLILLRLDSGKKLLNADLNTLKLWIAIDLSICVSGFLQIPDAICDQYQDQYQELNQILEVFMGQLRQLFSLKSTGFYKGTSGTSVLLTSARGFREWELDVLARQHACSLRQCGATLRSLSRLERRLATLRM
ncbi:hypothetical protein L2E82_11317 [Cichorium intybus]|uniref:Uncharacterized protein n=1 Tax=Cichorium intybus TaxID=13427 RepID=A0ACB9GD65_CICIN|nr:hypothetical protein L2E82_11317 [Cichorium intybus]